MTLYEKYHDEGNPFLRGPEDILRRLNKYNRYFTIFCDGKIVGGEALCSRRYTNASIQLKVYFTVKKQLERYGHDKLYLF